MTTMTETATRTRPPDYRLAMRMSDSLPAGESGEWKVEHFTVSEDDARMERLRAAFSGGRGVPAGNYVGLKRGGRIWMSDTPDEMGDHAGCYYEASRRGGRWLVMGLGLGMIVQGLLALENVEHVDVVELDADVIALVSPAFQDAIDAGRLSIHQGDAFAITWPKDTPRWSGVWADVWPDLCTDNLSEMATIRRKYGQRRAEWCDCWGRDLLLYRRRQERAHERLWN